MTKLRFSGPLAMRASSFFALAGISLATRVRHAIGRRMEPSWDADFETGIRFWRRQFTHALRRAAIEDGRQLFDSLQTETDDRYDVTVEPCDRATGCWYVPAVRRSGATLLYFHGGGYTFHGAMSKRYAAMLAHHCGARLFAAEYRLTPEHPHSAQAEDAFAAWRLVTAETAPQSIVVVGDSAGGHMALMLLQTLRREGLPQPALCIGLCPWTDIGDPGASLRKNDRFDLVQSWMAVRFGEWLDPQGRFGRDALSPIAQDYRGLAPLYLQAGGREMLCDTIRDFAATQAERGADVLLDLWPDMPHDFQAFDTLKASSTDALSRIRAAVHAYIDSGARFTPGPHTVAAGGSLRGP